MNLVYVLQVVFSLIMLSYVSWLDLKSREIDEKIWLYFSPIVVFILFDYKYINVLLFAYSFSVTVVVLLLIYKYSLMGGADVFAMSILGLANSSVRPFFFPKLSVVGLEPITVILYTSIVISLSVLVNFVRNYRHTKGLPLSKRLVLAMSGRKVKVRDFLNSKFLFPLTVIDESGKEELRLTFYVDEDDKEWRERYAELVKKGVITKDTVIWVAYGLPVLPYITLGYVISLISGIPI
ncbi:MAG: hypothetical protein ASUL_01030 [Candidatus Aramenus sulfurataquae]|uniref:Peptidase A24 n=1 Tax=Candidatus Aramenus sulfurataquae TaxID=1326980 RepID=W7L8U5_9CREN|nr:MAG: hypothetical protein ASUL_01030 [Candidatus Aramenus sulfurataquae]